MENKQVATGRSLISVVIGFICTASMLCGQTSGAESQTWFRRGYDSAKLDKGGWALLRPDLDASALIRLMLRPCEMTR